MNWGVRRWSDSFYVADNEQNTVSYLRLHKKLTVFRKFSENEKLDNKRTFVNLAQKNRRPRWKRQKERLAWKKVIHNFGGVKRRKKDLYTELSTLSTENREKFWILSCQKRTIVLSSCDKKCRISKKCWHLNIVNISNNVRN